MSSLIAETEATSRHNPPTINMAEQGAQGQGEGAPPPVEHLNIKVTDNNNEVFFKIKRTTQLKKLMDAFCERQGKQLSTVRFLFDGTRVRPEDTPETVCLFFLSFFLDARVIRLPRCYSRYCDGSMSVADD